MGMTYARASIRLRKFLVDNGPGVFGARALPWLLLPFAGGLGLVLWVLGGLSFRWVGFATGLLGAAAWCVGLYLLPPCHRTTLWKRVRVGIAAGMLGTLAYDVTRYFVVALAELSARPFAALPIFGQLIIGQNHSTVELYIVGYLYHFFINGIGFAVAYTIFFRRPGPVTGIAWALGLEAVMAALYPQFLIIQQYGEFLTMSVVGHISYGIVLGLWAKSHARTEIAKVATREEPH